jgi:hypothetical protein
VADRDGLAKALAEYLTGANVAHFSIYMEIGGSSPNVLAARRFFALREAAGISGYPTAQEAEADVQRVMEDL